MGKETHHTNSILIQHKPPGAEREINVSLIPDYEFDRKAHRSYKAVAPNIPAFHYKRNKCQKFYFDCNNNIQKLSVVSQASSKKTFYGFYADLITTSYLQFHHGVVFNTKHTKGKIVH